MNNHTAALYFNFKLSHTSPQYNKMPQNDMYQIDAQRLFGISLLIHLSFTREDFHETQCFPPFWKMYVALISLVTFLVALADLYLSWPPADCRSGLQKNRGLLFTDLRSIRKHTLIYCIWWRGISPFSRLWCVFTEKKSTYPDWCLFIKVCGRPL